MFYVYVIYWCNIHDYCLIQPQGVCGELTPKALEVETVYKRYGACSKPVSSWLHLSILTSLILLK